MNIALFGYGKMGKMIEKVAVSRKHSIIAKIDVGTTEIDFSAMDMAIDFSSPDAAFGNIKSCLENGVPVISGTTGWLDKYSEAELLCAQNNGAFIYASNFSLGVNIFFELNKYLSAIMKNLNDYGVSIEETHHIQKLDTPSGTAITLANAIIANSNYEAWQMDNAANNIIPIVSKRIAEIAGTHKVSYGSEVDNISIEHHANNREGFAIGAIIAAEWLLGKKGVYNMGHVLNLG